MNAAGLYGSDHGWDLPGYPDQDWQPVSLPDSWSARGIPAGVGWYRTDFSLSLPRGSYVPIDVQIGGPGPGARNSSTPRRSRWLRPAWPPRSTTPGSPTTPIYYTDGTSQSFTLSVGNFWYAASQNGNPANVQVAAVNYANYPTGSSGHTVYVFEQSVPLTAGKTVEAVTLPSLGSVSGYNAALHIFAISAG